MSLLFVHLAPDDGSALSTWDDLDARVRSVLPRVRRGFGVQEVWAHDRFFLRCMMTEMPSPHFSLTVFCQSGADPKDDPGHPVWPILARLVEANGWQAYEHEAGKTDRDRLLAIPPGAAAAPMPDDHRERVAHATPASGVDLSDLEGVPWAALRHAFGPATDAPPLLRAIASDDPHARREAYRSLYGNLYHQGSTYPATVAAVPFLFRILEARAYGPADGVLELLQYLTAISMSSEAVVAAACEGEAALERLAPRDDDVGCASRRMIACLARVSETARQRLPALVDGARSATERSDLLHFIGDLPPAPWSTPLLARSLASAPTAHRLAPALALARHRAASLEVVDLLFRAAADRESFSCWTKDEQAWRVYDLSPSDLAFDALTSLGEAELAGAIADAGGVRPALARWGEDLGDVAFYTLRGSRPLDDHRRLLLEVLAARTPWPKRWPTALKKLGLPTTPEALRATLDAFPPASP